jgi:hypothetical protein
MKNDVALQSLGFQKPKCEIYNQIKKEEIKNRIK